MAIDPEWKRCERRWPRFLGVRRTAESLRGLNVRGTAVDCLCHQLSEHAAESVEELIDAIRAEDDPRLRNWLLAALVEAGDPRVVSLFAEVLLNEAEEEGARGWAERGCAASPRRLRAATSGRAGSADC